MILRIDPDLIKVQNVKSLLVLLADIQIKAISFLEDDTKYNDYRALIDNFNITDKECLEVLNRHLASFQNFRNTVDKTPFLSDVHGKTKSIDTKWYNTMKHTLYILEPELIRQNKSDIVYQTWDFFFEEDIIRKETLYPHLKINFLI